MMENVCYDILNGRGKRISTNHRTYAQKLLFVILLTVLLGFQICNAQQKSHEIQLGYGPFSRVQVLDDLTTNYIRSLFRNPLRKPVFSDAFYVSYHHNPGRRAAIGGTFGIATGDDFRTELFEKTNHLKYSSVVLTFETQLTYLQKPAVSLYGMAGLGGLLVWEKDRRIPQTESQIYGWPTCQITPFGIRAGRKVGVFAELGYGYKGLVTAGLSGRF